MLVPDAPPVGDLTTFLDAGRTTGSSVDITPPSETLMFSKFAALQFPK